MVVSNNDGSEFYFFRLSENPTCLSVESKSGSSLPNTVREILTCKIINALQKNRVSTSISIAVFLPQSSAYAKEVPC